MIPTYEEFYKYFEACMEEKKDDPKNYTEWIKDKYEAWSLNGWKKEKGAKLIPIKNYKSTLRQCLPYRMPNKVKNIRVVTDPTPKKRSKLDEIMIDEIVYSYNTYKEKNFLAPPNNKYYDFLLSKGVFKRGSEISEKTGKPWQEWYNKLTKKALPLAVAYALDQGIEPFERNKIRRGEHELAEMFVKIEALKAYFSRFKNDLALRTALSQL